MSDSLGPHGLYPSRLYPWDFPGKNTGVGCHFLLQGIFETQGPNLFSCIGRQILYHWAITKPLAKLIHWVSPYESCSQHPSLLLIPRVWRWEALQQYLPSCDGARLLLAKPPSAHLITSFPTTESKRGMLGLSWWAADSHAISRSRPHS